MSRQQAKLVGIHEIASRLGFTKQRAHHYSKMKTFPLPIAQLAQGRVWRESDVATFFKNRGRVW
jgi:predicted DNA-binding transcriptional regulator AlpA